MGYLRPYHVYPNVPPAGLESLEDAFERYAWNDDKVTISISYCTCIGSIWKLVSRTREKISSPVERGNSCRVLFITRSTHFGLSLFVTCTSCPKSKPWFTTRSSRIFSKALLAIQTSNRKALGSTPDRSTRSSLNNNTLFSFVHQA